MDWTAFWFYSLKSDFQMNNRRESIVVSNRRMVRSHLKTYCGADVTGEQVKSNMKRWWKAFQHRGQLQVRSSTRRGTRLNVLLHILCLHQGAWSSLPPWPFLNGWECGSDAGCSSWSHTFIHVTTWGALSTGKTFHFPSLEAMNKIKVDGLGQNHLKNVAN